MSRHTTGRGTQTEPKSFSWNRGFVETDAAQSKGGRRVRMQMYGRDVLVDGSSGKFRVQQSLVSAGVTMAGSYMTGDSAGSHHL